MLPVDLPWIIGPFVRRIQPDLFLMSETDYWPFLLRALKKVGCKTAVVSGKLSDRSYSRLRKFPIAKWLYKNVDHFLLQTDRDMIRFKTLGIPGEKLMVTGNLKLSLTPRPLQDKVVLRKSLALSPEDRVITIGSTHEGEEKAILDRLDMPDMKILVVPRHPERFATVKKVVARYPNAILVDKMGVLADCYQISEVAIVGGSFVPIGGHDVLEPIKCKIPTLFGPHMEKQQSIVEVALASGYGRQTTLSTLSTDIKELLEVAPTGEPIFPAVAENTWLPIKALCHTL